MERSFPGHVSLLRGLLVRTGVTGTDNVCMTHTEGETIDFHHTYYTGQDPSNGSCGHRHQDLAAARACVRRRGWSDQVIIQVRTSLPAHELAQDTDPRAVVSEDAVIATGCTIAPYCVVRGRTRIGSKTTIDCFAVVGGDPQQSGFNPATTSTVLIGACVTIREGVTVHRSAIEGGSTTIGDEAYLMTNSHVGHDCEVGRGAVLGSNVMLAGHVVVGEHAVLGGGAGVHQFVRIGAGAMIGGNASISYDVPPFAVATERNRLCGLNLIGLRRREVGYETISDLKECYRAVFAAPGDLRQRAKAILANGSCGRTALGREFLEFFEGGSRGFVRDRRCGGRGSRGLKLTARGQ